MLFPHILLMAILLGLCPVVMAAELFIGYDLKLHIDPANGTLCNQAVLTLPPLTRKFEFALNPGFSVTRSSVKVQRQDTDPWGNQVYAVQLPPGVSRLELNYRGVPEFRGQAGLGGMPTGIFSSNHLYMDRRSAWYPVSDLPTAGFSVRINKPSGWQILSNGALIEDSEHVRWSSQVPHDELYLVGGLYHVYRKHFDNKSLSVWLLDDDPVLAQRYLGIMGDYIAHYSQLIGKYPFGKFAVVENRWETGFGMPSFTLLGSRVMRLPFIPFTSLPHEIAHNWLGNGIWVDYQKGNWSEGLTAYIADHWMKERRGKGSQHRLKSLQRYSNYAGQERDASLLSFVSRHNDTSQAIGYDKSMMLFHMIRRDLGNAGFATALQRLWNTHRYTAIGFQQALDTLLQNKGLQSKYRAWLTANQSPRLDVIEAIADKPADKYRLRVTIDQGLEKPLPFELPIDVILDGQTHPARSVHTIEHKRETIELQFGRQPLQVSLDPDSDVLRYLDPREQPPALNQLFGHPTWLVLPSASARQSDTAWRDFAKSLTRRFKEFEIIHDDDLRELPGDKNLLLLGWGSRHLAEVQTHLTKRQQLDPDGLTVSDARYAADTHSVVLVANTAEGRAIGFIGATSPEMISSLGQRLPHYGSYGRLIFDPQGKAIRKEVLSGTLSYSLPYRKE